MRSAASLAIGALVLVVAGCSSDPEPAPEPTPAPVNVEPAPATTASATSSTTTASTAPPIAPSEAAAKETAAKEAAAKEADDHCRLGLQYLNEGRHDDAVQAFSRAVELTPEEAFPHAARALALNHLGKSEAAVEDASRAIELADAGDAFVIDLYAFRGSVCTDLERWAEGEADLTRCIEGGKDAFELRLSRGTCELELGRLDRALTDADAAISRAPDEDARGRALWLRGLVHERAGRLEAALADLEAAAHAGNTDCADDRARVRAALGR